MNAPQPVSPRRRMQQLLAIPDRDRSDAEWDELNELEIQLAPGNRDTGGDAGRARIPGAPGPQRSAGGRPQGQGNKGGHSRQSGQPRAQQGQGGNNGNVANGGNVQQPNAQNAGNPGNAANPGAPAGKKQFRKPRSRPPRPEVV